MKFLHRLPTSQFAFVEFEEEVDNPQEGLANHIGYVNLYEGGQGLPEREWAKARNNMLVTGEFDPNLFERMNKSQIWFTNQLKLALRAASKTE